MKRLKLMLAAVLCVSCLAMVPAPAEARPRILPKAAKAIGRGGAKVLGFVLFRRGCHRGQASSACSGASCR